MRTSEDPFDLSGKTALVTGGARGLGFAMARALGQRGAKIALLDLDFTATKAAGARLRDEQFEVLALAGDVTLPGDSARAVRSVIDAWGSLDVCVANAGVNSLAAAEDITPEEWQRVIGVNLTGVFFTAQAAARAMIAQKRGSIVTIASMSGLIVNVPQKQSVYNISKAGVIMATKSLASEWAEHGIRVNAIAPGYMRTDMTAKYFEAGGISQQWIDATPLRRPGEPAELAGAVVYLASDASSFVTGSVLVVDGGYVVR